MFFICSLTNISSGISVLYAKSAFIVEFIQTQILKLIFVHNLSLKITHEMRMQAKCYE